MSPVGVMTDFTFACRVAGGRPGITVDQRRPNSWTTCLWWRAHVSERPGGATKADHHRVPWEICVVARITTSRYRRNGSLFEGSSDGLPSHRRCLNNGPLAPGRGRASSPFSRPSRYARAKVEVTPVPADQPLYPMVRIARAGQSAARRSPPPGNLPPQAVNLAGLTRVWPLSQPGSHHKIASRCDYETCSVIRRTSAVGPPDSVESVSAQADAVI